MFYSEYSLKFFFINIQNFVLSDGVYTNIYNKKLHLWNYLLNNNLLNLLSCLNNVHTLILYTNFGCKYSLK